MMPMILKTSRITINLNWLFVLLLGLFCSCSNRPFEAEVGKPLPQWENGYLDIHHINTGRGECVFYVLPDGTTMLVDAGEFHTGGAKYPMVDQKPDTLTRPYKVYVDYMKAAMGGDFKIDYAVLSHYHMDHMGRIEKDYAVSDLGYVLSGMTAIYDEIPYAKIIDRTYPEYEFDGLAGTRNWGKFVSAVSERDGVPVEKFELGTDSQITLVNKPSKYPEFKIFNWHTSGYVWDNGEAKYCWGDKEPRENGASIGFMVSYGKFDWFTAGDAGNNGRVEKPVARAIGREIEAMKGHHHMSWHTMTPEMLEIFRPQVVINQSFYGHQPWPETLKNVLSAGTEDGKDRDVFLTNYHDSTYADDPETLARVKAARGHVVLRVLPGGDSFYVYMLDDTDMEYKVKGIYGPYYSK